MSILLYIRGQKADTDAGSVIAQTLQINDIASVQGRNATYTNTFKLPKTANNVRIMDFMTLAGNTSSLQYEKNECSLYSAETGQCFIYKGWATITDGGEFYNVSVVDGIIDLFKAIENKTLSDLDNLTELSHAKSIEKVKESWMGGPYRYILADFNGDTGNTAEGTVNIDYLVPSVNVKYLWDRIFEKFGFTYSGSVFSTQAFVNLWMTFPKGLSTSDSEDLLYEASEHNYPSSTNGGGRNKYFLQYEETDTYNIVSDVNEVHLKLAEPGSYRIALSGRIKSSTILGAPKLSRIDYALNAEGSTPHSAVPAGTLFDNISPGNDFELSKIIQLPSGNTSICFIIAPGTAAQTSNGFQINRSETNLALSITRLSQNSIDFGDALIDFSVKDFINEIVNRFGLTIYPDNTSGNYTFLTLQEMLQGALMKNWSCKLVKKISENYIYGSYARRNWFRYNYNDKEAAHNDWFLDVNNAMLPDSRDAFTSKIYTPENQYNRVSYLNRGTNVYRLWDKEPDTDPETGEDLTKYKSLDKRYYFMRAEQKWGNITLQSKTLEQAESYSGTYYLESYWKLSFYDILQDYYTPFRRILDTTLIVTADLWLTAQDIAGFDFKKLYYFEQFSNYFMVNKISNFVPGRPTRVELVRVLYELQAEVAAVSITSVSVTEGYNVHVYFSLNIPIPTVTVEYKRVADSGWSSLVTPYTQNPWHYSLSPPGLWEVRIKAGDQYSDTIQFTISY